MVTLVKRPKGPTAGWTKQRVGAESTTRGQMPTREETAVWGSWFATQKVPHPSERPAYAKPSERFTDAEPVNTASAL